MSSQDHLNSNFSHTLSFLHCAEFISFFFTYRKSSQKKWGKRRSQSRNDENRRELRKHFLELFIYKKQLNEINHFSIICWAVPLLCWVPYTSSKFNFHSVYQKDSPTWFWQEKEQWTFSFFSRSISDESVKSIIREKKKYLWYRFSSGLKTESFARGMGIYL